MSTTEGTTPMATPTDKTAHELEQIIPNIGAVAARTVAERVIAVYEAARRPEWDEVMIATLEKERDDARDERDRARNTAVRLEQELHEAKR